MIVVAIAFMVMAEFSDFLDGFIARHFEMETELGKLVDPVCDSIYRLTVFLAFLKNGWLPAWMFFLIYARDLIVPYLRTFARQVGHDLEVRWSGKAKAVTQGMTQILSLLAILGLFTRSQSATETIVYILMGIATAVSIGSLVDYGVTVYKIRQEAEKSRFRGILDDRL